MSEIEEFMDKMSRYYAIDIRNNWPILSREAKLSDLKKYRNFPWEWYGLIPPRHNGLNRVGISNNPNINMKFVLENLDKNWDWVSLSGNENAITIQDIENNINLAWDWLTVVDRSDLTIDFVDKHVDRECPPLWERITRNISITKEDIIKYSHFPWDWERIHYINLKLEFVIKYLHKIEINYTLFRQIGFEKIYGEVNDAIIERHHVSRIRSEIYRPIIRTRIIKQELIEKAFHPSRVEKWLEIGGIELVNMMFD